MFGKVIFTLCVAFCAARSVTSSTENVNFRQARAFAESKSSVLGDLRHVYRVYEECSSKELVPCLKLKFITAIDRLSRKVELPIVDGIVLVKDEKAEHFDEENEVLESNLPRSMDEKNSRLDEILIEKIVNFISSRNLQFKLSGVKELQRSFQDSAGDARGKKGKYNSLMLLPLMMGGSMIPMALGVLALLAGKALIIAKLALTLSLIIGLKKLLSNDDHGAYQVVSHGGGHYRRSLHDDEAAQSAAYRAYIPLTPESSTSSYTP